MPELSTSEYELVYNAFSFTFAAMFASFLYFVLVRNQVAPKYRGALTMSALVVAIAGYHYFRIFESWQGAFAFVDGSYIEVEGASFNDAYRYIDWLLTVPLLVAELVAVMALSRKETTSLTIRLGAAAALMVILGYPGEIADDNGTRIVFGILGTLPFLYIVYVLFTELGSAVQQQAGEAKVLLSRIRWLLLATWTFYPVVFAIPLLTDEPTSTVVVAVQVGYCIADVAAKCGYGLMIYSIAKAKSEADGYVVGAEVTAAAA